MLAESRSAYRWANNAKSGTLPAEAGSALLVKHLLGQEPVDIAAVGADEAAGGRIHPVEAEKAGDRGIELCLALVEVIVLADFAAQINSGHLGRCRVFGGGFVHGVPLF